MAANPLPIDALKLIVNFAQLADLEQASVEQLRRIERSVQRFINRESEAHERYDSVRPDWKALEDLRVPARKFLDAFASGPSAIARELVLTYVVSHDRSGSVKVQLLGSPRARMLLQIVRVLEAVGPNRLLKCPACGKLFVKVTKKTYCSTRCYGTTYMKAYRKRRK